MTVHFEIERFESQDLRNKLGDYWMRVPEQISLLNRFIFLDWASARLIAGWVPAAKELEWKSELCRHMWIDMTCAHRLLERKEELAANAKIHIPTPQIQTFLQDVAAADGFYAFLAGWYMEVKTEIIHALERLTESLDPIFDAPTLELITELLPKKRDQIEWAKRLIHECVKDPATLESVTRWRKYARDYVRHLNGIDGRGDFGVTAQPAKPLVEAYGPAPKKRTMPDWLKKGDFDHPPEDVRDNLKIFMWHYMTEIQVVDPMCYVFYGMDDMPFEFFVDFSRHIWDECRHHQMGVRRLEQLGFDIKQFPIPFVEDATQELEHFYAELTMFGESCSFSRKKKSMDSFYAKSDIISGMTAEIDIVDERTHVKFGKKWTPFLYKHRLQDDRSLDDIVRGIMDRRFAEAAPGSDLSKLNAEERSSITHFAFCGKIEFKNLVFDKL
ncbi:DUF455 family protein [Paenibacillus pectinilyticus]|nr:DUF455 family protein [Paenibacillus pectinilyticus]